MRFLILLYLLLGMALPAAAIDINGQLKRADLETLSADPSSPAPAEGRVYLNTTSHKAKYLSNSAWLTILDTTSVVSGQTLTGDTVSNYVDMTEQGSAPSSPAASTLRVYAKTDDKLYTLNSSGVETAVGSGAGEKNYISKGTSTAAGWTASGAGVTVTTDSSAADLPDPSVGTAVLVTGASGSSAYAFSNFTLDPADYNKKLKVSFDQACGLSGALTAIANCASSDFKVDVYSCTVAWSGSPATTCSGTSARLNLSTDSSAVSALPNLTGTYRTAYDAPGSAAKYIQLRVGLNASVTHAVALANVVVGPGVVTQGAALSGWTSFTPTISNYGTVSAAAGQYRRVGADIECEVFFTAGTTTATVGKITLPLSLTIDTSAIVGSQKTVVGYGLWSTTAATLAGSQLLVVGTDSADNTAVYVSIKANTLASGLILNEDTAGNLLNGASVSVTFKVPVSQWAGNGTVNVAQNDVEYAWNSGNVTAAGGSDTTSFGYGPAGTPILSYNSTTGSSVTSFTVQFQTPISQSDRLVIEVNFGNTGWFGAAEAQVSYMSQGNASYGIYISQSSSTQAVVRFANMGHTPSNTTYAGAGEAWSALSGWKWRLKKERAGAAIGFGIVSGTASGLMPSTNTSLDDASATRLGLKQYVGGTTYNGVALTVTGPTSWTAARAVFVPYQMNDGIWRCRFNLYGTGMSGTGTQDFTVAGLIPKSTSSFQQPVTVTGSSNSSAIAYAVPSGTTDPGTIRTSLTYTATTLGVSGDIELNSKPTWAY